MRLLLRKAFRKIKIIWIRKTLRSIYFLLYKIRDFFIYTFSKKLNKRMIVLTFDDEVNEENIKIARFLAKEKIRATFFVPGKTKGKILKELVKLKHEIAGHGYWHNKKDKKENYFLSAKKTYEKLKKYYNIKSWRFPFLSYDKEHIVSVYKAGFKIDSSVTTFYPLQKPSKLLKMIEYKWLYYPTKDGMDLHLKTKEDFKKFREWLIKKIKREKGIFILPFHIWHQYENFDEFKKTIEKLKKIKNKEFKSLDELWT